MDKEKFEELRPKYLPNREVWLKKVPGKDLTLIKKDKNFSAHSFMYEGAVVEKWLPMDERKNYFDPFESDEEREFFEFAIGRNLGLDYRQKDCAWNTGLDGIKLKFEVTNTIKTVGYRFDLSKPYDALTYRVAKCQRDIAKSLKEGIARPHYIWYLSDGSEEVKQRKEEFNINSKVWRFLGRIEDSKEKMMEFLEVYYMTNKDIKEVPEDISDDALKSEIENLVDIEPNKVLKAIEDKDYDIKVTLIKGIKARAIEKSGVNSYNLPGGNKQGLEEFIEFMKLLHKKKDTDDTWATIIQRIEISE